MSSCVVVSVLVFIKVGFEFGECVICWSIFGFKFDDWF